MRGLLTALALMCAALPATAQDTSVSHTDMQFMMDVLSLDPGGQDFETTLPRYLDTFRQNDFDGEPGYSARDREIYVQAWEAQIFSKQMEEFLLDDLNGDLSVDTQEKRVSLSREAYTRLRRENRNRTPTPIAVEGYIAQNTASYLRNFDLDGDRVVSFDEAGVKAREIARHARSTTVPVPRLAPSLAHDLDGDTTISEQEMIALARQVHAAYDLNGSGQIEPPEREQARRLREAPPAFMLGRSVTSAREVEGLTCPFPPGDESLSYYVIGGFEGAAMTTVHFENQNEAVEAVHIAVPETGPDIRLVAAFQTGTIVQLDDPGRRVRVVYDTRGPIGLRGAATARLVRTDPSCHLELWKPISPDNPDPRLFYKSILKRAPAGVISGYTVGLVDLESLQNNALRRFPTSIDISLSGSAAGFWTHFVRFNPGGLVEMNARFVTYGGTVGQHPVYPQYAGLAELVTSGALSRLPRDGRIAGVGGKRLSVTLNGRSYRLGGGDDAITSDGLIYRYERPGRWTGRAPVKLRVEESFVYPAGLNGAHAVAFVLPADVPAPIGNPGQSTLDVEGPDRLIRD